jgi:hypothetical protein
METKRSHRRRVAYSALITLLLTLVPSTVHASAKAPVGQASLRLAPTSAPLNPDDPFYRGAFNAGSIWTLSTFEAQKIQSGSTRYGVSVYNQAGLDAGKLNRFTCIYEFVRRDVPGTLRVQQRGRDPNHNEIMPNFSTTVYTYTATLALIPLARIKGGATC